MEADEPVVDAEGLMPLRPRCRVALYASLAMGLITAGLVVVLVSRAPATSRVAPSPMIGRLAPEVAGTTIDGDRFDLASLRGRWVVVNFFATWCVPCRKEHPELVRFDATHRARGDVTVVGVIYDDDVDAVREFRAAEGGSWPMLSDPDGRIGLGFGITGVPETFLIAPDQTIVNRILGGVVASDLEEIISSAGGP